MSTTLAAPEPIAPSEPTAPARRETKGRLAVAGLVIACCLITACYSLVVPAFEAPDEPGHYAYVQWIASGKGIPLQGQEPPPLQPEFSQPPLYYLIEAPLARLAGSQPANLPVWEGHHNPFQNRTDYGNVNLYLHSPAEDFPWRGEVLGLHLTRLANVLFVALMVLATYGCSVELALPGNVAWLASATVGLLPQVLFLGGALNADNAVGSLSAASLYLLLRWLKRGPGTPTAVLLGLVAGGAALSKLSGLLTVGLVLGFMGARALGPKFKMRDSKFKGSRWRDLACASFIAVLIAGWWYVRNWLAFGDPLGWNAMLLSTGDMLRQPPLSFSASFATLMQHAASGLALFGWTNLPVSAAWYWAFAAIGVAGLLGFVMAARQHAVEAPRLAPWLMALWPLAFLTSLTRWVEVNTAADQWRLLFPAYPALTLLLVIGWCYVVAGRWKILLGIPAALLVLNIGALALVIAPAYAEPQGAPGPSERSANVQFGDSLELVGYATPQPLASRAGQTVDVDLFWRVSTPVVKDYATDIGIIDAQTNLTWKELSIPDEGRAPMSAWPPGQIIRDRHQIHIRPEMVGAQSLILSVIDPEPPGTHLPARNGNVRLANDAVTLTRFLVLQPPTATPSIADNVAFQDQLRLAGHTLDQTDRQLRVSFVWAVDSSAPSKDYTVFVHMTTTDGRQVAQHDGQPGDGAFPTSLLPAGASVADRHVLDVGGLPPGGYKLEVGLYELSTGARLPTVAGASSVTLPVTLSF